MKLLVTVDVESMFDPADYSSLSPLDDLLSELGFPCTLFITPDVVSHNPELVRGWHQDGHRIALHIHPERITGGSDKLSDYDADTIEDFLLHGCQVFEEHLDRRPLHFRAGRWEYCDQLLAALSAQGFRKDASLVPRSPTNSYIVDGVEEIPMTVYTNSLVRYIGHNWDTRAIPTYVDWFLERPLFVPGFYTVTWRVLRSDRPYLMLPFHDYDVMDDAVWHRTKRYLEYVSRYTTPTTIDSI